MNHNNVNPQNTASNGNFQSPWLNFNRQDFLSEDGVLSRVAHQQGDIVNLPVNLADKQNRGVIIIEENGTKTAMMGGFVDRRLPGSQKGQVYPVGQWVSQMPPIEIGKNWAGGGKVVQVEYMIPDEQASENISQHDAKSSFSVVRDEIRLNNLYSSPDSRAVTFGKLPEDQAQKLGG
ncbi:hypothetical protein FWF74_01595 [Candidatus Saccharibacteria bacterium]|nr:hypothetical protein [Candidatus Saccharibacteria bacterium]MCL1963103.1 hypothetical protein [Candidatus Saccharibacteria bacterium]